MFEKMNRLVRLACVAAACLVLGSAAQGAIVIDTVHVCDAGNAADTTGYGSVWYEYNIGKYEVTAGQYTAFLNAVAATDTYSLYNSSMAIASYGCGITRSGSSGSYTYTVDSNFVNRPVNWVNFLDTCRFANWLNNGQQGAGTTEYGAYTLTAGISGYAITRKANWQWAVTSEDEWYKAAYYKGGSASAGYWLYPTQSNTEPGQDMNDVSGNNANFWTSPYTYPIDGLHNTTEVGEFENSESYYGTFDQGGNIWEWTEGNLLGSYRCLRGGSFSDDYDLALLRSGYRGGSDPTFEFSFVGFRVSQVPEPGSAILLVAVTGILLRRRNAGGAEKERKRGRES